MADTPDNPTPPGTPPATDPPPAVDPTSTTNQAPATGPAQAAEPAQAAGPAQPGNPAQAANPGPKTNTLPPVDLKPMGSDPDGMREVSERETVPIRTYRKDAYGDVIVYQPRSAEEFNQIQQARGEIDNRRIAVIVGSMVVILVTLVSLLTFLGLTNSSAPGAHEDAVRLLILIVGAVLGAIFGAEISKDRS